MREIRLIEPPGPAPYGEVLALQHRLLEARVAGRGPDALVLVEHAPVITLGRYADAAGVLTAPEALARLGIAVHRVERGGQVTYHGPGQVVGYPVLRLRDWGLGPRAHVTRLEEVMLRAATAFGVEARRVPGRPGVFTDRGKLGAVGVAVRRGVGFHGFALNVRPDLGHFRHIVPCGLADVAPTSLAAETPPGPDVDAAQRAVLQAFADVYGAALVSDRRPTVVPRG